MALDGAMLHLIKKELEEGILGAKVDKVFQPSREMLILAMRGKNMNRKMLISASANSARIHFTEHPVENPAQPPMLCICQGGEHLCIRSDLELQYFDRPYKFDFGIFLSESLHDFIAQTAVTHFDGFDMGKQLNCQTQLIWRMDWDAVEIEQFGMTVKCHSVNLGRAEYLNIRIVFRDGSEQGGQIVIDVGVLHIEPF